MDRVAFGAMGFRFRARSQRLLRAASCADIPFATYQEGMPGVVHACGSQDHSRSHFKATSAMERGVASAGIGTASGGLHATSS